MEPEWRSFQCPLCHVATGSGRSVISQHLSAHLEEISLAALPLDVDSDNEDDSDDESTSDGSEEIDEEHLFKLVEEENEKRWARQEDEDGWRCLAPGCNLLFKAKPHFEQHVKNRHSNFLDSKTPTSCLGVTQEKPEACTEPTYGDKTDATAAADITTLDIEGGNKPANLEDLDRHLEEANSHLRALLDLQVDPSLAPPLIPPYRNSPNVQPFNVGRADAKEDSDPQGVTGNNMSTVSAELVKGKGRAVPPSRCFSCNRTDTTEWRRGPDGARTLCNACGLHYAKVERKRQLEARLNRPNAQEDIMPRKY